MTLDSRAEAHTRAVDRFRPDLARRSGRFQKWVRGCRNGRMPWLMASVMRSSSSIISEMDRTRFSGITRAPFEQRPRFRVLAHPLVLSQSAVPLHYYRIPSTRSQPGHRRAKIIRGLVNGRCTKTLSMIGGPACHSVQSLLVVQPHRFFSYFWRQASKSSGNQFDNLAKEPHCRTGKTGPCASSRKSP